MVDDGHVSVFVFDGNSFTDEIGGGGHGWFDLGLGLVWVVVWWGWWLDFEGGDGFPRLALDLGLVMGGFWVHRGGGKVVGFGVGDRIWISGFVVGLMMMMMMMVTVGEQITDGGCERGCGCSKNLEISKWRRDGFDLFQLVFQEMLQLGVVAKSCLVLQVDSNTKTKDKARELLKLHARAWKNSSSCVPLKLLASYPAA